MLLTLNDVLTRLIRQDQLRVTWPDGSATTYGPGPGRVAIRLADDDAVRRLARDPTLATGELYMDGRLVMEEGSIYDFLSLVRRNGNVWAATPWAVWNHLRRSVTNSVRRRTGLARARANIAHHYDIDERLYRLFLDADMNYSCAYFEHDGQSLEDAQRAKQRHIAGKLLSQPGGSALDIGCGWGGMGLYLSEVAGLETTGITLSAEQARVARERAAQRGMADRFRVEITDYREKTGRFDHVVSVGMLEHVGLPQMDTYFAKVAELLDKRGTALIHSMAQTKPSPYPQPFGEKYIFPGGYIPALSEIIPSVERAGLLVKDIEILPLHYAETTRLWRERFLANRERVLELFDERFLRMWEIYLAGSEVGFRHQRIHVVHLLLAKHQDRIPIRRGWLEPEKERLRAAEAGRAPI
ncbi:class I SAM-dependent methyltransferase [Halovulum dunhuangense]|uniref:Class I SAM-dependent methyltransferase n=1 Tax=Halovulum dunhuangense TaxID=1505036 RepID=A0A849L5G8_9RHOB|nr:cyclopropane-fatty-acyl-phospholipid synthase family protein [Halovulum dunhuangense]NNU81619.1 class I SAM-dependent methyltransferase [Halovulum dunhuangense]